MMDHAFGFAEFVSSLCHNYTHAHAHTHIHKQFALLSMKTVTTNTVRSAQADGSLITHNSHWHKYQWMTKALLLFIL